MQYRVLGDNHLTVSAIGLGCFGMSHVYGHADEKTSIATIHQALDSGLNFLDTADYYGDGHNERLVGKALAGRRDKAVLATKFGFVKDEEGNRTVDGSPSWVRQACEASLKRLQTDVIDLYYLHRLDPQVPVEETVGAMAELVKAGKIRSIGLSEVSVANLRRAHAVHPVTALQSEYSLWHRDVEPAILPTCKALKISLVPYCPLGRGFLAGGLNAKADLDKTDFRHDLPRFQKEAMAANLAIVEQLKALADQGGQTPAQLALAWLLAQDEGIVPIPGMKRPAHLEENLKAVELQLSDEVKARLTQVGQKVVGARYGAQSQAFIDR
ncbi:MAG: aldo/keto reductase [Desulfosarcinaceae bacterium]